MAKRSFEVYASYLLLLSHQPLLFEEQRMAIRSYSTEGQRHFLWQQFWQRTIYLTNISAKDNFCGEKLIYEVILVDERTIFMTRFSKNSGSKGSPRTIFVAKRPHKDNFYGILQTPNCQAPDDTYRHFHAAVGVLVLHFSQGS
jgi:hypothetical protein